ncbi:MAG: four helix bundle protein [Fimbriimonadaceae bacterium]|nr:four helix bundle protein [Fimbriimonadaceae bacterium]
MTTIVYDATVAFCELFVDAHSRTVDQMVQAARSGRQNIAEGSRASGTSSQTELRLLGVARASLDELLLDYEDFLRQRRLPAWTKDHPEALAVREIGRQRSPDPPDPTDRSDPSDPTTPYARWLHSADPAQRANCLICLIHQANYLLDQQIRAVERDFVEEGGYSERLAAARFAARQARAREDQTNPTDQSDRTDRPDPPTCPRCGSLMKLRTVRQGSRAGERFWGCARYPDCRATTAL